MSSDALAIHGTLDQYESAIERLLEALARTNQGDARPKLDVAIEALIAQDEKLSTALDEVYQHRLNSKLIDALQQESLSLDAKLQGIMSDMAVAHKSLMEVKKKVDRAPTPQHETVEYSTLIKYAERIATATRQSSTMDPVVSHLASRQHLPWPTENMMKRGALVSGSSSLVHAIAATEESQGEQDAIQLQHVEEVQQDPTIRPNYDHDMMNDVQNGIISEQQQQQQQQHQPAPTDAVALDLDLFDPDEDD